MKKLLTLFILFSSFTTSFSQTFDWVKKGGGSSSDWGNAIGTDGKGNVYVTGSATWDAKFDSVTFPRNFEGLTLIKYSPSGKLIWIKTVTNAEGDAIKIDAEGNCYVTGIFNGEAIFKTKNDSILLEPQGGLDLFVAKFDTDGNALWANMEYSQNYDYGNAITIDKQGNCYITGSLNNSEHLFACKYNNSGTRIWKKEFSENNNNDACGFSIELDSLGNIYIGGGFGSKLTVGGKEITGSVSNTFIVKLDNKGTPINLFKIGEGNYISFRDFALSNDGLYVTGIYGETAVFGNTALTSKGRGNIFLCKLTTEGEIIWAKTEGDPIGAKPTAIALDKEENLFLTGVFAKNANFGEEAHSINLNSNKQDVEVFFAKFNSNGELIWAIAPTGSFYYGNWSCDIICDNKGNCYATGATTGVTTFGNITIETQEALGSPADAYILKMNGEKITTSSINLNYKQNHFTIYPNPTTGNFSVSCQDAGVRIQRVCVRDLLGNLICNEEVNSTSQLADASLTFTLRQAQDGISAKGIYFVEIVTDKGSEVQKIIVN